MSVVSLSVTCHSMEMKRKEGRGGREEDIVSLSDMPM